ncbi:MAG: tetratricopeptide repeat protein [Candidatus Hydrogenedentota bacterium]
MKNPSAPDTHKELRRRIEKKPRDAELHRELGFKLWKEGDLINALIEFRKVLRINPANREAPFALAAISRERGQFQKAFEILFDIACPESMPTPHPDAFELRRLEHQMRIFPAPYDTIDWKEFFAETERRVRVDPAYSESRMKEGRICLEQKCYDKAIRTFTRLAVLEPRNALVRLHRAMALSARRRDAEAEKEFSETLLLQPKNAAAYKGLGIIRARRGDLEKARYAFTQVLQLDPQDAEARRWLEKTG